MIERYALPEIQAIWDDQNKYNIWKEIEILACEARMQMGQVPADDLQIIKDKAEFSVERINEIEQTTNHDVIAFLTNLAEHIGPASRHVHYGMTSSDILDTTLSYQMKQAGELIQSKLEILSDAVKDKAIQYKSCYCIGRTHGIHAEPTTIGLKFLLWFEEIKRDISRLQEAIKTISVGQISGAVGTFDHLSPKVEEYVCEKMGLAPAPVSTQIIQRDRHAHYLNTLAIIGGTLEKMATEFRHLQKTEVLEMEEPFKKGQKGSSAMPHKKNPIICERIAGMSRILRGNALAGMENMNLWHERDITHSSVERVIVPDSTMLLYYMLEQMIKVVNGLSIYEKNIARNLNLTRGLIFSQKVLLLLTEKGITREEAYSIVQSSAMYVWENKDSDMLNVLSADPRVQQYITRDDLQKVFDLASTLKNIDYIYQRCLN
ncbi:MAG: adenylosuccinate lyase [Ignavibacteria bacterium]|nr:adenylosuccinate lyase [Ignavibacteria bacterium]